MAKIQDSEWGGHLTLNCRGARGLAGGQGHWVWATRGVSRENTWSPREQSQVETVLSGQPCLSGAEPTTQRLEWTLHTEVSVQNHGSLGPTPTIPTLVRPSCLPSISSAGRPGSWTRDTAPCQPPQGALLHRGRGLTRMSPLDSCRQCRASSWLVPAPGKMLEQAAVSRSSTGGGRREKHLQG